MAPASATQKPKDLKEKGLSRASSTSKADPESPVTDANGTESSHLKELQKYDSPRVNLVAWRWPNAHSSDTVS
jgi:hypothetical protein